MNTWQSLLRSGEGGEEEARLRRFDGEYRWFLFRAVPVPDGTGRLPDGMEPIPILPESELSFAHDSLLLEGKILSSWPSVVGDKGVPLQEPIGSFGGGGVAPAELGSLSAMTCTDCSRRSVYRSWSPTDGDDTITRPWRQGRTHLSSPRLSTNDTAALFAMAEPTTLAPCLFQPNDALRSRRSV